MGHGALYHSQSVEAFFSHIPGLKVSRPPIAIAATAITSNTATINPRGGGARADVMMQMQFLLTVLSLRVIKYGKVTQNYSYKFNTQITGSHISKVKSQSTDLRMGYIMFYYFLSCRRLSSLEDQFKQKDCYCLLSEILIQHYSLNQKSYTDKLVRDSSCFAVWYKIKSVLSLFCCVFEKFTVEDVPVGDYELPLSKAEVLIEGLYAKTENSYYYKLG